MCISTLLKREAKINSIKKKTERKCATIGFQSLTEAMDIAKRTGPLELEAVLQMKVPALRYRSVMFKSREFCDHALLKTSGLTAVTVSRELAVLK